MSLPIVAAPGLVAIWKRHSPVSPSGTLAAWATPAASRPGTPWWVAIETPHGSFRARARLDASLEPQVVFGQHGWWQACPELDAPGYDPFSGDGANFNGAIGDEASDPVSGSIPLRAYLCEVRRDGSEGKG